MPKILLIIDLNRVFKEITLYSVRTSYLDQILDMTKWMDVPTAHAQEHCGRYWACVEEVAHEQKNKLERRSSSKPPP